MWNVEGAIIRLPPSSLLEQNKLAPFNHGTPLLLARYRLIWTSASRLQGAMRERGGSSQNRFSMRNTIESSMSICSTSPRRRVAKLAISRETKRNEVPALIIEEWFHNNVAGKRR